MTINKAKRKAQVIKKIKNALEYIVAWAVIIILVLLFATPIQYAMTKHCIEKQYSANRTHATITIGGEKITLDDVEVIHIEEK